MVELFYMGGVLFMSTLTLVLAVLLSLFAWLLAKPAAGQQLDTLKSVGLFAAVTGVLGQLVGLFSAFQAIEQMGAVSPAMLAGGLKVSSITTLYGLSIYLLSLALWGGLKLWHAKREVAS